MIVDLSPYEKKEDIDLLSKNLPSSNIFVMLPYLNYLLSLFKCTDSYTRLSMFNFNEIDVSLKSGPLFSEMTGIYGLDIVINNNISLDRDKQVILNNISLYTLNLSYLKLYVGPKFFKVFDNRMFINRNFMGDVCVELIDSDYSDFVFPLDYQLLDNIIVPSDLNYTNYLFIGNVDLLNSNLSLSYKSIYLYLSNDYLSSPTIYHLTEYCLHLSELPDILHSFTTINILYDGLPSSYEFITSNLCEFIKSKNIRNIYFKFSDSYLEYYKESFGHSLDVDSDLSSLFKYLSIYDDDFVKLIKERIVID